MKITKGQRLRIRREMGGERATVWIGKEGATEQVLKEVERQLEKYEVVKVKLLRSVLRLEGRDYLARRIAHLTDSTLIEVRGNTLVLYKPRKKRI
ncbi:MAG: YhbY family RNA-binding protein [Candidatus Bathyarchaeia archaeon]